MSFFSELHTGVDAIFFLFGFVLFFFAIREIVRMTGRPFNFPNLRHLVWLLIGVVLGLNCIGIAFANLAGTWNAQQPKYQVNVTTTVKLRPLCSDLDEQGYDGLMACFNEDGELVAPGGN